ncbi:hypothetical protein [Gordonia soli]|uniref:Uncharacterized protein n=1 Tax=Gordonia soli NBRC 108243 TaxID=1223545 RepID=M0QP74_9ACTN|nr:hypothetical protein [Gordonia soli]GAC70081.1 hypothetical protein GS4_32_00250 [Gordonia soli NBRC 108243]
MSEENIMAEIDSARTRKDRILERLFDIRNIIAELLGIYGVALVIAGLLPAAAEAGAGDHPHSTDPVDLSAGSSANIWVGIVLLVVAALFAIRAAIKPNGRSTGVGGNG